MKVKFNYIFNYMDSATGETEDNTILEIKELTGEAIVESFNKFFYAGEHEQIAPSAIFKLIAFDKHPDNIAAAVIMSMIDPYFGCLMLTGFAYVTSDLAVPNATA